jgi:EAL domain-containing protein (putative c-di-GMP-specific phosphodiesterase class I)
VSVGAWVMCKAIAQLAAWDRAGLPGLCLAVNLSARQLRHPQLGQLIADMLQQCEIDPARLEIELTESLLMEDNQATRTMLATFKRLGVRLALDDFGTGHSSLAYLRRFHLHTLKIDRSFVSALPNNVEDMAISRAIIALGHSMNMTIVAEGVETEAQALALHEMGCNEMQGYLLARPMAGEELPHWLHQRVQRTERARLARLDKDGLTRLDIMLDGGEIWVGTESPALEVWRAKRFVECGNAPVRELEHQG